MNKVLDFIKNNKKLCLIISSILVILIIIIIVLVCNSKRDKRTEQEKIFDSIRNLAIKYYEETYYPAIASSDDINEKKMFLNDFRYNGIKFKLKVLLKYKQEINYNDGIEYKNSKSGQDCDPEKTTFIITPYEPYGVKDYKIDVALDCGF